MSTQILRLSGSLGFGKTTRGDTHGVGPIASSMIPISSRRCISLANLSLEERGPSVQVD